MTIQNDPQQPEEQVIDLYQSHKKIHPKWVKGRFANLRIFVVLATQLFFFVIPWLSWNNRQAVLLDIASRKFYIFGLTIWPQDLFYLSGLLICAAFGLFWWTTIAGRLWCGYACPQTVYTEIMLWFDYLFEGDRNKRMKFDKEPWHAKKIVIKSSKYLCMALFCLWVGFTFVGFFSPIRQLWTNIPFNLGSWETFWIFFYGGFTFLFAHILREQVCKYMCPYARFQSAMFDPDTLVISYDESRGEPRGARKKEVDYQAEGKGACIDCTLCVQVCPVGIDIRDGLQYECIGCAACIDVCNEVMDKMDYPRGLIRYTTESALQKIYPESAIAKRMLRPKVVGYGVALAIVLSVIMFSLLHRIPFKVDIIKDRSTLVRENNEGWLENTYTLKIMNTSEDSQHLRAKVTGFPEIQLEGIENDQDIVVPAGETMAIAVQVATPPENAPAGSHPIMFEFTLQGEDPITLKEKSIFIGE